jgi:hypothetical protein
VSGLKDVLDTLKNEYGFCHGDSFRRNNYQFFPDSKGKERLMAIDLEQYNLMVRDQLGKVNFS